MLTKAGKLALLAGGIGAAPWTGSLAMLWTASTSGATEFTVLADLTEATFTGYARSAAVVWGAQGFDPVADDVYAVGTTTLSWKGPADASGQNVVGWALVQPAAVGPPAVPAYIIAVGQFQAPVPLEVVSDVLSLTPDVDLNGHADVSVVT